jgi:hypothetical protein
MTSSDKSDDDVPFGKTGSDGAVGSDTSGANGSQAANASGTLAKTKALSPEDAEFEDLVDGPRDLFTEAVKVLNKAEAERDDADLPSFEPVDNAEAAAIRALYELGDDTPVVRDTGKSRRRQQSLASLPRDQLAPSPHLTGADPRFVRDVGAELAAAAKASDERMVRDMIRHMGAASDSAAAAIERAYSILPRLHQLCWLGLSGVDIVMRRAAAADVVAVLPDLAESCAAWMETVRASDAERLGLDLAALIDWRAFKAADPSLSSLATGVLMASLQAPLLRSVVMNDLANDATSAASHLGLRAAVTEPMMAPNTPTLPEGLQVLRLFDAGLAPLPLGERRISLTEPARRVAAALRDGFDEWHGVPVELKARLQQVIIGIGMLLSGATRHHASLDTSLLRTALEHAQAIIAGTVDAGGKTFRASMEENNRKRADEVKSYKLACEELEQKLDRAETALSKLGLDPDGKPLAAHEAEGDAESATDAAFEVVVCPKIEVKNNSKLKDAIQGHEHMPGQPVPLAPTGNLPGRRKALLAEFPYALDVIDFVLGDLTSKPTVTIRPVLLTGTPGSGKTHFARRFAHHFGLHVWSVDCAGSDGSVFAGTDRRWFSAEPSHPFLAMSRGRQANPLIILDELEKAPTRQDYGRMWDSLLPFLDPGSNKQAQDKCLQVPIDASHINYIATANRVDQLPWPLRDRLRIVEFPEPTPEHLPALIQPLLAELAASRSLDPRFIAPLTEEDQAFLARNWRGGSVRRLSRLIEAIINAREREMPRH